MNKAKHGRISADKIQHKTLQTVAWRRTVIWSVAIGVAMLVFDLLVPMTMDWMQGQSRHWAVGLMSDRAALRVQECLLAFTTGLIVGVLASQLLLLVVYAALGDGNSFTRIVYATFLLTIVTTIISNMWWLRASSNELVTGIVSAMLLFFLLQIPAWGIRSYFGWTIISPWSKSEAPHRIQFSVAHLLGWTALLAIVLRIMLGINDVLMRSEQLVVGFVGLLVCAMSMSCVYITFTASIGRRAIFTSVVLLGVAAQLAAFSLLDRLSTQFVIVVGTANCSGIGMILLNLSIAYRLGFRLRPFDRRGELRDVVEVN